MCSQRIVTFIRLVKNLTALPNLTLAASKVYGWYEQVKRLCVCVWPQIQLDPIDMV